MNSKQKFKTMTQVKKITVIPIISRIPQANSILDSVHQTIHNIINTLKVQDMVLNDENPWDRILASILLHYM